MEKVCIDFFSVVADTVMRSRDATVFKSGHFDIGMLALQQGNEQVLVKALPNIIWHCAVEGSWLVANALRTTREKARRIIFFILD